MREYFYLSSSRRDGKGNPWLKRFYIDLAGEVARTAGLPFSLRESDVGFFSDEDVEFGRGWEARQAEALNTCKSFVCLYTRSYFKSEFCGKEFQVFRSRLRAFKPAPPHEPPQLIFPVLWDNPSGMPDELPEAVSDIQIAHAEFGETYADIGLSSLMKQRLEIEYQKFLIAFAYKIVESVESTSLPPLQTIPPPAEVASAFHGPGAARGPFEGSGSAPSQRPEAVTDESRAGERLRIFLCHDSADKPAVRDLYRRLQADGFAPWLDEEDLLGGQVWEDEIPEAVRSSHVVLVCLSNNAINKAGFIQKEIRYVLDVADEQPEGTIFLIPLKLEECEVPRRLSRWQWINFFREDGYERLMRSLRARAGKLGGLLP